jgi:hypothetical protein
MQPEEQIRGQTDTGRLGGLRLSILTGQAVLEQ